MTDTDNANYQVLPANIPVQAESQLHSLEQVARGIRLHVDINRVDVF